MSWEDINYKLTNLTDAEGISDVFVSPADKTGRTWLVVSNTAVNYLTRDGGATFTWQNDSVRCVSQRVALDDAFRCSFFLMLTVTIPHALRSFAAHTRQRRACQVAPDAAQRVHGARALARLLYNGRLLRVGELRLLTRMRTHIYS